MNFRPPIRTAILLQGAMFALPTLATAQSARVSMTADRTQLSPGETFGLEIRADVSGVQAPPLQLPDLSAFEVVGRQVVRPMQFSFGFGSQQQMVQSSIVHRLTLRALRPGKFRITPASLSLNGRRVSSPTVTIEVGPGSHVAPTSPAPPAAPAEGEEGNAGPPPALDGANYDSDAFLRTVVSNPTPWVGEQVTVTVYLYSRRAVRSSPVVQREPAADGFWNQDLLPPTRSLEARQQIVRGRPFDVYVLRRFAAFPIRAGKLEIGAMKLSFTQGSLFDLFDRGSESVAREGVPVTLKAKPLPAENQPSGAVAVGRFTLSTGVDREQVKTGDAVTVRATARGTGNVRDIRLEFPSVDGLRALEPQVRDEITTDRDVVGGARTWEWIVIAERGGRFAIPPLRFWAFDPETERYVEVASKPTTLIAAGNPLDSSRTSSDESPDPAGGRAPSFGPIRTRSELRRDTASVSDAPWFPWALAVPPAIWLVLSVARSLLRRRRRGRTHDPSRAMQQARKQLAAAPHATADDPAQFYSLLRKNLQEVLEAKLREPIGSYTYSDLRRRLMAEGMPDALAERCVTLYEEAELSRFGSAAAETNDLTDVIHRTGHLLSDLEGFQPRGGA